MTYMNTSSPARKRWAVFSRRFAAKLFLVLCREIVDQSGHTTGQCSNSGAFTATGKGANGCPCACTASNDQNLFL